MENIEKESPENERKKYNKHYKKRYFSDIYRLRPDNSDRICFLTCLNSVSDFRQVRVFFFFVSNGNRTEWSLIRSVIVRVITKSDDRAAGVRFVYHEYDYRPNWTPLSPITN